MNLNPQALPRVILIRYGELGLKGDNRSFFEKALAKRVKQVLAGHTAAQVRHGRGRLYVHAPPEQLTDALQRLRRVFGAVAFHPAFVAGEDMAQVNTAALAALDEAWRRWSPAAGASGPTFKINARRANKMFSLNSMEINRDAGAALLEARRDQGLSVDVQRPDITVHIEVRDEGIYIYAGGIDGPGGLPVGVSGRLLALLSGGIDSPVAVWMALKRGVTVEAIHFHSYPFTSDRSLEKVVDLSRILARWGGRIHLHVVHFTEIQKAIRQHIPADLGITVMRRMMYRIAAALANHRNILGLITGESIGQVASQTLESMTAISAVTRLPIFRPLVGLDKSEIIELSHRIGTYETSILPYEDCCSLFVPRHPRTRPRAEATAKIERRLDVSALTAAALREITTQTITED